MKSPHLCMIRNAPLLQRAFHRHPRRREQPHDHHQRHCTHLRLQPGHRLPGAEQPSRRQRQGSGANPRRGAGAGLRAQRQRQAPENADLFRHCRPGEGHPEPTLCRHPGKAPGAAPRPGEGVFVAYLDEDANEVKYALELCAFAGPRASCSWAETWNFSGRILPPSPFPASF